MTNMRYLKTRVLLTPARFRLFHGPHTLIETIFGNHSQTPVVEFLLQRGANVNHGNAAGNTPLHFAMLYDTSGQMGEFLITNGADDSIENKRGCSPCKFSQIGAGRKTHRNSAPRRRCLPHKLVTTKLAE